MYRRKSTIQTRAGFAYSNGEVWCCRLCAASMRCYDEARIDGERLQETDRCGGCGQPLEVVAGDPAQAS